MFKKIENNVPVGNLLLERDLRVGNPELGDYSAHSVESIGYGVFIVLSPPRNNDITKEYVEGTPLKVAGNTWEQTFTLQDKEFESIETKEALVAQEVLRIKSEIRRTRNDLLTRSDWMTLSDTTEISADMVTYRQALRDIIDNTEDLYNVIWPDNPSLSSTGVYDGLK